MTADHLKGIEEFEAGLWKIADTLRANSNLASNEYFMPIMGLLFLRQATNRYYTAREAIEADRAAGRMPKRPPVAADFARRRALMLAPTARFDEILKTPKDGNLGAALIAAMEEIERAYPPLAGQLPKDYARFDNDVLESMMRTFDNEVLRTAAGDVFGRIYEYFLAEFSKQGAHDNGEFYTPPSIVQTIVNVIEPEHGIVLDPACGTGGMFVQSSHFIERAGQDPMKRATFYGHEKNETTAKLAQINLAVNGLEGKIRAGNEAITYCKDPHELAGKCDFVMANPPFNVDEVDAEKVKGDKRLPFGLPGVNKGKKVSNANYLWLSYFYSYLNENGRAGVVMSSQAASAGRDEAVVRQKIVETGAVDVMIDIRGNFFYTRTVPCQLWFFDRPSWTEAPEHREAAIGSFGFTERQARFLVAVMLHGGVRVERLYRKFAGIAHGQKTHDFFGKLVNRGHATSTGPGALHRGRFYHVHHKTLYRAIGEPDNRNRKPLTYAAAVERLMLLDAILAEPQLTWLGSAHDKLSYFRGATSHQLHSEEVPHLTFGQPKVVRHFPDKLPIGVHRDGRPMVFLYLVTRSSPIDFRAFLDRHAELWRALYHWELRVLFPRSFWGEQAAYERAFHEQLAAPMTKSDSEELAWLFRERRRLADTGVVSSDERFRSAGQRFRAPRFRCLYRAWRRRGDAVIWPTVSNTLVDKVDQGRAPMRAGNRLVHAPGRARWDGVTCAAGEQGGDNMPRRSCPLRRRRSSCPLEGEPHRNGGVLRRRETASAEHQERESGRERPHLPAARPSRPRPGGRSRQRVTVASGLTWNVGDLQFSCSRTVPSNGVQICRRSRGRSVRCCR